MKLSSVFALCCGLLSVGCGASSSRFGERENVVSGDARSEDVVPAVVATVVTTVEPAPVSSGPQVFSSGDFGSRWSIIVPGTWKRGTTKGGNFVTQADDKSYSVVVLVKEIPEHMELLDEEFGREYVVSLYDSEDPETILASRVHTVSGHAGAMVLSRSNGISMLRFAVGINGIAYVLVCGSTTESSVVMTCSNVMNTFKVDER